MTDQTPNAAPRATRNVFTTSSSSYSSEDVEGNECVTGVVFTLVMGGVVVGNMSSTDKSPWARSVSPVLSHPKLVYTVAVSPNYCPNGLNEVQQVPGLTREAHVPKSLCRLGKWLPHKDTYNKKVLRYRMWW